MWTSFLKWRKRSFETVLTYVIYHLCNPYLYLIIHFLLVLTVSFGIYNLAVHSIWHLPTLILPHFLACQIFLILSYLVLTFSPIFRNVFCSLCLCSLPFFDFYCFKTEVIFFFIELLALLPYKVQERRILPTLLPTLQIHFCWE